ncbi:MAG: dTDP-6-deoxy-L-hexose 3-O-methyltransferase [Chitinivibrionales bacterium]|nr:dTDP-6-deoxy-L-hexose 3-O-methyltransferase [Chitinivibrionales bacterium]
MSKMLAQYELFKMSENIPGAIVECGVFKGVSLVRWAMYRSLFSSYITKKIVGFDIFGKFPTPQKSEDKERLEKWFSGKAIGGENQAIQNPGEESISIEQLTEILKKKGVSENIDLIKGDVIESIPRYIDENPELRISLLNLDTDVYEPAATILEHLYPRLTVGGILLIDDYAVFPGETKAVDEYFKNKNAKIRKLTFSMTPSYIIKESN